MSDDSWATTTTAGPDNTFYFDVTPTQLTQDQKQTLGTYQTTLNQIRADDIHAALAQAKASGNTSEIQVAKLVKDQFDTDTKLSPGDAENRSGTLQVNASNFHAEIISLAAAGFDIPSHAIAKDLENLVNLIKADIVSGGSTSGKPDKEVKTLVASLFTLNAFTGEFTVQIRYIYFVVNFDLYQVCQNKESTSVTDLLFEFHTADYTLL